MSLGMGGCLTASDSNLTIISSVSNILPEPNSTGRRLENSCKYEDILCHVHLDNFYKN